MGKKLENFINKNFKKEQLKIEGSSSVTLDEIYEATKKQIISEIEEEIKSEFKNEIKEKAIEEAETEIENEKSYVRIKELKSMMFVGIGVAFLVGISVNQLTETLLVLKTTLSFNTWWGSLILFFITIGIAILIIINKVFSSIESTIKSDNKGAKKWEKY